MSEQRVLDALLRSNFSVFARKVAQTLMPGETFLPNWHQDAMAYHLEQIRSGQLRRLAISLPPRMGKSLYASVALPAFIHGHNPHQKISCFSYGHHLAAKNCRDYRNILLSDWYQRIFPGTKLSAQKNSETEIALSVGGFRLTWSKGGSITGRGANLIILDDPIKAEDVYSDALRKSLNDTFDGTVLSRTDDKERAAIIIVMQRLHLDDLIGHATKVGDWTRLSLPAIAEADERIQIGDKKFHLRKAGEPLHAERESLAALHQMRQAIGSVRFSAQYQQQPVPPTGNVVQWDWFSQYRSPPDGATSAAIVQSWDTAGKGGVDNAYSACLTVLKQGQHHYVLDVFRDRLNFPELKRKILEHAKAWAANTLLIEDAALGAAIIQDLRSDPSALQPIAIRPEGDKLTRMMAASATIESRSVFLPTTAPWLDVFKAELLQFPFGAFKDQVDALSQYLNWSKTADTSVFSYDFGEPLLPHQTLWPRY